MAGSKSKYRNKHSTSVHETADSAAAAAIADNIDVLPEHAKELLETEKNTVKVMPRYRNRVMEIIRWMKRDYPREYSLLVFELSEEQKADLSRHYYTATHDIRYNLLDAKLIKLFLSGEKKWKNKEKTIQYNKDYIRGFHDAILKCAKYSSYDLPLSYYPAMKEYIDTMKKEKAKAKSNRQVEEKDADAIGMGLYELLCTWAVQSASLAGIMVWAFLVTQWNVMGRTVNVDPLGFHNIRKSQHDSIVVEYDYNKADQTGEKTTPKNVYSHPGKPFISWNLAMGCYLCINQNKFKRASDKIFIAEGKDGTASNTFSKNLKNLIFGVEAKERAVRDHNCRDGHFHPHGLRKGAGTHVTTCTMEPPPIPSVLMRGEWNLGKVLEVYWKWSMIGDTYLGRCLAGFNPDEPGFGMLPSHFKVGRDNVHVEEGMRLCFGGILDRFSGGGIEGALLLFLASIVYHADTFLLPIIADTKNHPFLSIPILSQPDLLSELQKLVTLEPGGDVTLATGVPRHVKMYDELKVKRDLCNIAGLYCKAERMEAVSPRAH
jgi:hypothetical protein